METLDKLLESVTNPDAVEVDAKNVSDNFLVESALMYASILEMDMQNETMFMKIDDGLGCLIESAISQEEKLAKTELIIEATIKEMGEYALEKIKELIAWVKGKIAAIIKFIKEKTDKLNIFYKIHGQHIKDLKDEDCKKVTYKGFDWKMDAYTVVGKASEIFRILDNTGLNGGKDKAGQDEAVKGFDAKEFKKNVVKAVLGSGVDGTDPQKQAKEMLQGGSTPSDKTGSLKAAKDMDKFLQGKKDVDAKLKNELEAIHKELNTLYSKAEKNSRDAKAMKKNGKTAEAASLNAYATKQASAASLALGLLDTLISAKLAANNYRMNEAISMLKKCIKASGKTVKENKKADKKAKKDADKNLNEATGLDAIGDVDELSGYDSEDEE